MDNLNLTRLEKDGLEFHIDETSGRAYAHANAVVRMLGIEPTSGGTIRRRLKVVSKSGVKTAEIQTTGGLKVVSLYPAEVVFKLAIEFNPELAVAMGSAGANQYMLGLAGYELKPQEPKTALQLAKEQVALLERIEAQEKELELQQLVIDDQEKDLYRQAHIIDELHDYSSIIRIAKYNRCSEKQFNWRKLKASSEKLELSIKKAPCPRYGQKNLYHHDAWRLTYPLIRLPETTTLVIKPPEVLQ